MVNSMEAGDLKVRGGVGGMKSWRKLTFGAKVEFEPWSGSSIDQNYNSSDTQTDDTDQEKWTLMLDGRMAAELV